MTAKTADAVVVGGGIIGLSCAWRLAQRGRDVVLVERGEPGREASWAAGGMLSPLAEADQPGPFFRLGLESLARYPAFVAEASEAAGVPVDYRTTGKLLVALDAETEAELERRRSWQEDDDLGVEWLTGEEARRLEPALAEETRAALYLGREHAVDNRALTTALRAAAARAGVRFELGRTVAGLRSGPHGRIGGVALDGGETIDADQVLVAAGAWSGSLTGLPAPLPVFPVRGQMAAIDTAPPLIERVVLGGDAYMVPRSDGRVIIGSTMEQVGFRPHATAGGIGQLLTAATRTVPALADAPVRSFWAGLRPGTPDGLPILGPDGTVDGLFYATGHFRNGILLAPATADRVASAMCGEAVASELAAFAPDRFRDGAA